MASNPDPTPNPNLNPNPNPNPTPNQVYYIGIIDILTSWSAAKSVENLVKKVRHPTLRYLAITPPRCASPPR